MADKVLLTSAGPADSMFTMNFRIKMANRAFINSSYRLSRGQVTSSSLVSDRLQKNKAAPLPDLHGSCLAMDFCSVPACNNTRRVQCQGCSSSALCYIDSVLGYFPGDPDGLTAILLISLYVIVSSPGQPVVINRSCVASLRSHGSPSGGSCNRRHESPGS